MPTRFARRRRGRRYRPEHQRGQPSSSGRRSPFAAACVGAHRKRWPTYSHGSVQVEPGSGPGWNGTRSGVASMWNSRAVWCPGVRTSAGGPVSTRRPSARYQTSSAARTRSMRWVTISAEPSCWARTVSRMPVVTASRLASASSSSRRTRAERAAEVVPRVRGRRRSTGSSAMRVCGVRSWYRSWSCTREERQVRVCAEVIAEGDVHDRFDADVHRPCRDRPESPDAPVEEGERCEELERQ